MTTSMPAALDTFVNPGPSDNMDNPSFYHDVQHDNLNDAMAQVQKITVGPTVYNAKGYGVVNSGSASSAATNTAFLAAVGAGELFYPPGVYIMDGTDAYFDFASRSGSIRGVPGQTIFKRGTTGTGTKYLANFTNNTNLTVSGIQFYVAYTKTSSAFILGAGTMSNVLFDNCHIKYDTWDGTGSQPYLVNFSGAVNTLKDLAFNRCRFENTLTGGASQVTGMLMRGASGLKVIGNTFININNPLVPDNTTQKYDLTYALNTELYTSVGSNFEGPDLYGWDGIVYTGNIQRAASGVTVLGSSDIGGLLLDINCRNFTVTGNKFFGNSVSLAPGSGAGNDVSSGVIANNVIYGTQSTASINGCIILLSDTGAASDHILIANNQLRGTFSGSAVQVGTGYGNDVRIVRNPGWNPQGVTAVTVGASPFTYTAGNYPEVLHIDGGTVSTIAKNSSTLFTSTGKSIPLEPHESVITTYSSLPTMKADRK